MAISLGVLLFWQPGQAGEHDATGEDQPGVAGTAPGHTVITKGDRPQGVGQAPTVAAGKSDLAVNRRAAGGRQSSAAPDGKTWAPRLLDVAVSGGKVRLNSYRTTTMPLDEVACAALGDDLVSRLGLDLDAVQRLAANDLMQQMRVCAINGSILITCYNGTATVSLRNSSLGDGCGG